MRNRSNYERPGMLGTHASSVRLRFPRVAVLGNPGLEDPRVELFFEKMAKLQTHAANVRVI